MALGIGAEVDLGDLAPAVGQSLRVGALQLGRRNAAHPVGADVGLPVGAGRCPGAADVVAGGSCHLVHLEEHAAGVGRVQLHADVAFVGVVHLECDPDAHLVDMGPACSNVADLGDDHVAGVAATALLVSAGGSVLLDWRDALEELGAHRPQHVLESEDADTGIGEARLDAENALDVRRGLGQVGSRNGNLTKTNPHARHPRARPAGVFIECSWAVRVAAATALRYHP